MIDLITPSAIISKTIVRIVAKKETGADGFTNIRCFVQIENNWIELDSRGVDEPTELFWVSEPLEDCTPIFQYLSGQEITHVVISDYLPTFGLILSNAELLYCSDLGPPFLAFGPLHQRLGDEYTWSDMVDFWERKNIAN